MLFHCDNLFLILEQPLCYPGDIQFDIASNVAYDGNVYVTGYPTVCYNDTLAPICNTTDLSRLDIASICIQAADIFSKNSIVPL